jgi:hypothetical protein
LADKLLEELRSSVAFRLSMLFQDLVGKFGTSFERKVLTQNESVVAVEQNLLDLLFQC